MSSYSNEYFMTSFAQDSIIDWKNRVMQLWERDWRLPAPGYINIIRYNSLTNQKRQNRYYSHPNRSPKKIFHLHLSRKDSGTIWREKYLVWEKCNVSVAVDHVILFWRITHIAGTNWNHVLQKGRLTWIYSMFVPNVLYIRDYFYKYKKYRKMSWTKIVLYQRRHNLVRLIVL